MSNINMYAGTPRKLLPVDESVQYVSVDENFKYETVWKGAGVAIPVFSLRSEESMGIGEFLDLKGVVDWACLVGLKLIQVSFFSSVMPQL